VGVTDLSPSIAIYRHLLPSIEEDLSPTITVYQKSKVRDDAALGNRNVSVITYLEPNDVSDATFARLRLI
jgi:hypothetical protein